MRTLLLAFWGLCMGNIVASGVCGLLTSLGIITRLAWRTKTQDKVRVYEYCVFIGTTLANFIYIYRIGLASLWILNVIILGIIGIFFGIFVGCLALSLAEALDVSTIIFRKFNIRNHTKYVLLAVAVGKFIGNIIYFAID